MCTTFSITARLRYTDLHSYVHMLACIANVSHTTLTYAHNYILLSLSVAHCHTHSAGFDCKGVATVWCCIVGVIYKGNRNNLQLHSLLLLALEI